MQDASVRLNNLMGAFFTGKLHGVRSLQINRKNLIMEKIQLIKLKHIQNKSLKIAVYIKFIKRTAKSRK